MTQSNELSNQVVIQETEKMAEIDFFQKTEPPDNDIMVIDQSDQTLENR